MKDRLIATTGLAFYADRDQFLSDLIGARLSELGVRDCLSYTQLLGNGRWGDAEMDVLTSRLTIGETYFFRDEEQFAAIRDVILPDILGRNQSSRRLRIWCAGCATGAEPYSLAILLAHQMGGRLDGWHIDIHATDLNQNFLTRARDGKFRAWALHSTCEEMKRSCFSKDGLLWTIHPRYKQWISFRHMNLIDGEFQTHFDLVLCRNVMIYFTAEANTRLVGRLHQSIVPGGWLVVGASEHKTENYKLFRSVNAAGAKVYQRIPSKSAGVVFPGVVHPRVTHIAQPIQPAPVANFPPDPRLDLNGLLQLANRGDWKGAARYGERLLHEDRLNPAAHFYQALIFENLGRADRSERSFRQAIYLDRNFAVAHYHLGLALKRSRQLRAADRCFTNVLRILTGMQADAVVTAGAGVSVTGLRDLAKMHLAKVVNGA